MKNNKKTKSIVQHGDSPEMDANNPTIGEFPEKDRMWRVPAVDISMLVEPLQEVGFVVEVQDPFPETFYGLVGVMASRIRRLEILVERQHEQLNPKIIIPEE